MAAEIKTGVKIETSASRSLRKAFKAHCAKLNVSVRQRLRDMIQAGLKKK